jgi:hypothetical protein
MISRIFLKNFEREKVIYELWTLGHTIEKISSRTGLEVRLDTMPNSTNQKMKLTTI